jgi:FKBP-type peptidyl-prolyl cis-trans isomerase SlyD
MQIATNSIVSFDYTLTNGDGQVLDTSSGKQPLSYLHGAGNIIPGLESELAGKQVGDNVKVTVAPAEAYGERDEKLVQPVPRAAFKGIDQIQPGMQFTAQSPQGARIVTVVAVAEEQVTIDANHPLAGQTLHFDVTIRDVRQATEDELNHGHAHGPGGAHH